MVAKSVDIAQNRRAKFDYFIEKTVECGLVLQGWEVKSLRQSKAQISDAYVRILNGEAWLVGSLITPLVSASTHISPDSTRTRKLLLHQKELNQFTGLIQQRGYTLVALRLYWKLNRAKLSIGLAKGKKHHDKRQTIKERDWKREQGRILKYQ